MLGNQIGPIEWTLVIRQVARQPLPRVIPEKTCIEVSHCYRQDQDTHLYILKCSMDGFTTLLLQYTCGCPHSSIYSHRLVVLILDSSRHTSFPLHPSPLPFFNYLLYPIWAIKSFS